MNTTTRTALRTPAFHTATRACPCCGEPTFTHDLVGLTVEEAVVLLVHTDAEVCRVCAATAIETLEA